MDAPDPLVRRAQEGDREAFAALVREHQAMLRAFVAMFVADREDVLDIVQDAFVDAWRGLGTCDASRPFRPWLRAICRHRIAHHFRSRARQNRHQALVDEALLAHDAAASAPGAQSEDRAGALARCLERLAPTQRELLDLRFSAQWRVGRIAEHFGKSANAISMMLLRLKGDLAACAERGLRREAP